MPKYCVVIPLIQRDCQLIPNVPIILENAVSVRTIRPEHIGTIIQRRKVLADSLHQRTKCIVYESASQPTGQDAIESMALRGTFVLNVFAESGSVMCENAFVIKHVKTHSLIEVIAIPNLSPRVVGSYAIDRASDPAAIAALYVALGSALTKDKSLPISVRRFNAALSRDNDEDRLIDLTICLESIFGAQTEVSFRFSLYNAILAEDDPSKRRDLYTLLKKLYSERSNVVHGNKGLTSGWVQTNWPTLVKAAKISLLKKIEFLQGHSAAEWQDHLDNLALGI